MKSNEKYEVDMLKIIIIIMDYTLNNFNTHITILQQMMQIIIISKLENKLFLENK